MQAFYLPGSVSLEGKALGQWNNKAPPLYVWSRSDWVQKHREIALQKGHIKLLHTPMLQQHLGLNISTQQPSFQQMEHTYSTVQILQNVDIEQAAMPSSVQLPFQNVNGFCGNMPGMPNMEQPFLTPTPFHHHSRNPPGGFQHMQKNNHHQTVQLNHRWSSWCGFYAPLAVDTSSNRVFFHVQQRVQTGSIEKEVVVEGLGFIMYSQQFNWKQREKEVVAHTVVRNW